MKCFATNDRKTFGACCVGSARYGAALVEFALVFPLLLTLIFAAVEFGRLLAAYHFLEEASREGCRVAILASSTTQDVEQAVADRMEEFGIADYDLTINPNPPSAAAQWDPVKVTIVVDYIDVSWLPAPDFLADIQLTVSCTLPRESDG